MDGVTIVPLETSRETSALARWLSALQALQTDFVKNFRVKLEDGVVSLGLPTKLQQVISRSFCD